MSPAFPDETAKILLLDPLYSERRSADQINVQRSSFRQAAQKQYGDGSRQNVLLILNAALAARLNRQGLISSFRSCRDFPHTVCDTHTWEIAKDCSDTVFPGHVYDQYEAKSFEMRAILTRPNQGSLKFICDSYSTL